MPAVTLTAQTTLRIFADGPGMTTTIPQTSRRQMLNKVPEVTVCFWIIKILCTTVGESFADYINETLGFGLTNTMLLFSAAARGRCVVQFRLRRYMPGSTGSPWWWSVSPAPC